MKRATLWCAEMAEINDLLVRRGTRCWPQAVQKYMLLGLPLVFIKYSLGKKKSTHGCELLETDNYSFPIYGLPFEACRMYQCVSLTKRNFLVSYRFSVVPTGSQPEA